MKWIFIMMSIGAMIIGFTTDRPDGWVPHMLGFISAGFAVILNRLDEKESDGDKGG